MVFSRRKALPAHFGTHIALTRYECFAYCRDALFQERLMNRVRAMLSGALTIAMLATGLGAATVSLAQEADEAPGEPLSEECQAFAADQ